jgi:hypothetical protein
LSRGQQHGLRVIAPRAASGPRPDSGRPTHCRRASGRSGRRNPGAVRTGQGSRASSRSHGSAARAPIPRSGWADSGVVPGCRGRGDGSTPARCFGNEWVTSVRNCIRTTRPPLSAWSEWPYRSSLEVPSLCVLMSCHTLLPK